MSTQQYIDVVMLTKSGEDTSVCQRTLKSLHDSETDYIFRVILIESGKNFQYGDLVYRYITLDEEFNYNRFLNIGFKYTSSDWVLITNDDVGYEKGWLSEMMKVHQQRPDIESFSPKDPMLYMIYFTWNFVGTNDTYYESYRVSEAIMGWSILVKKTALDKILPFDEQFDMYFQDNDYGEMLKLNGIKHAVVRNSIAVHLGTMRVKDEPSDSKIKKCQEDELKFRTKWNIWT
jgi:GT2 family glycosyltransferase